jgi:hypothetical protein
MNPIAHAASPTPTKPANAAIRTGSGRSCRGATALIMATTVVTMSALFGAGASVARASAGTDRLTAGQQLNPGERLVSPGGQYALVMQGDGNLVEYAPGNRAVWATGTNRANSILRMQDDGNLVIVAPGNISIWATSSHNNPGAQVEMQGDGNVVVYGQPHQARWASGVPAGGGDAGRPAGLSAAIVATAQAELANTSRNRESTANCNFYSGQVAPSAKACGNGRRSEQWCADFARWVWGQAGATTAGLDAGAVSFTRYGESRGTWRPRSAGARVGDAVVFNVVRDRNNRPTSASHVGLVIAVNPDGTITTIEGNAGANTDRVVSNRRSSTSRAISGYTSPVGR